MIPEDQVRLCAVADGAPWIWKWVEELFPSARQILDYYHCSSYLHAVAEAQYGADPEGATQWLEASLARLFCGEGAGVVWGLQRHEAGRGRSRRGDHFGPELLAEAPAPGGFRQSPQGRIPDRLGCDRIGASLHRPCSSETIRRLVV